MPRFYVLSGPELGRTHDVGEGAVLGRSPEVEVPVAGGSVSRRHARLERSGARWVLVDLGSRNGIQRDKVRVRRLELEDGMVFQLGEVELRFREGAGEAVRSAPSAPEPAAAAPDEIVLEELVLEEPALGETTFSEPRPAPSAPPPSSRTPGRPTPRTPAPSPPAARPAPATPGARPGSATPSTQPLARGMVGGARTAAGEVEVRDAGRPILQYARTAPREGFLVSDLAQQPGWVKLLVGLLVVAFFGGVFLLAFRGASFLKGRAQGSAEVVEELPEELPE